MDTSAAAASTPAGAIDTGEFLKGLEALGYADEILERKLLPGTRLDTHTHAWDTRLMVLQGSLTVGHEGRSSTMGPGETFEIARNVPHTEVYAADTETRILVGRRHR